MARNDFAAAFLKGLYDSGIGNPAVNEEAAKTRLEAAYKQKQLDLEAQKEGLVPVGGAQPTPGASPASGNVHPDTHKIIGAFKSILFPGSTGGPSLNTAYTSDPSQPTYAINGAGTVDVVPPGKTPPEGEYKIPQGRAITLLGAQGRAQSKPKLRIAVDPSNKDNPMRIVAEDYVGRPGEFVQPMDTDKAINEVSKQEIAGARKDIANTFKDRVALMKRQAVYGGKLGDTQRSLNTVTGHLLTAQDAYDQIQNTNQEWLNVPINKLKASTNDPYIIRLGTAVNAVRNEISTTLSGRVTDEEMKSWQSYLNENLTPDQAASALSTIAELAGSRAEALQTQQELIGGGKVKSGITPKAKSALEKLAPGGKAPQSGQAGAWTPAHESRLQELLRKQQQGTLDQ